MDSCCCSFTASELPAGRGYDRLVAITRSGTTTEVLSLLGLEYRERLALVDANHGEPISRTLELIGLSWAVGFEDGWSVIETSMVNG